MIVVVFLTFQSKAPYIYLVCSLSTSLSGVIASSPLLAELNLLFHITYVLKAWESAELLAAKQSDDLPTATGHRIRMIWVGRTCKMI